MIDPAGIPVIAGNMDALHGHADTIAAAGTEFADTGADLHSVWQGLATCYVAPESEQLLAATGPIRDAAATIGEDWRSCAAALHVYADATAAVQVRLADIRARAELFVAAHTAEDVAADEGLQDVEAGLLAEVGAAMAEWDAAQRECANAISALHGGPVLRADDGDGVLTDGEFGYSAEQYTATAAAGEAPWVHSTTPDRGIVGDLAAAFFGGLGEAVVGGVVELGGLFGRDPVTGEWSVDAANGAWQSMIPVVLAYSAVFNPAVDSMDRAGLFLVLDRGAVAEARLAAGKSLIAYDQWDDDPSRAAGNVVGNLLMAVVGTKGAGAGLSAAGRGAATVAPRVGAGIQNAGAAIARMPTIEDLAVRAQGRLPAFGGPRYALPEGLIPESGLAGPPGRSSQIAPMSTGEGPTRPAPGAATTGGSERRVPDVADPDPREPTDEIGGPPRSPDSREDLDDGTPDDAAAADYAEAPRLVSNPVPLHQRLEILYERLGDQPPASTADGALAQVSRVLEEIEDEYSGVLKNPNPGYEFDGRLYPPREDNITRTPDGGLVANTRGSEIYAAPDGSLRIISKRTGKIEVDLPSAGIQ